MPESVLLFAGVREKAGQDRIEIPQLAGTTAADVLTHIATSLPQAAPLVRISRLAVDDAFVAADYRFDGSEREIALIPPVSGG